MTVTMTVTVTLSYIGAYCCYMEWLCSSIHVILSPVSALGRSV